MIGVGEGAIISTNIKKIYEKFTLLASSQLHLEHLKILIGKSIMCQARDTTTNASSFGICCKRSN